MQKKHKVVINVVDKENNKTQVLKHARISLPKRIISWLFGDYCEVLLLQPGKSVDSINIKEVEMESN